VPESKDISIKMMIIVQTGFTVTAYALVFFFISPSFNQLWLHPGSYAENFLWGVLGALTLFLPVYLYGIIKEEELFQTVKALLPFCQNSLVLLGILSLAAGLGEELFFRAFLQELYGIKFSTLTFMLAHSGFWFIAPPGQTRLLLLPFYLGAGAVLGLLAAHIGLISAITAHFLYNLLVFSMLQKKYT